MIPILTSMSVSNNKGKKYLQPHYAQVNHNAVDNMKTLHITHTALGNPFHDPFYEVTQLSNFGTDACIFIGFDTKVIYRFKLFVFYFITLTIFQSIIVKAEKIDKGNQLHLKQLNPLTSDKTIITSLFPDADGIDLMSIIGSTEFVDLLKCDATTSDGRAAVAAYFNVNEAWDNEDHNCDFVDDYYNLLYLVKTKSTKDHIYISFVEGLHRHTAIITSLLCTKFDHSNNTLVPGSLTVKHFEEAKIPHFKTPDDSALTPRQQICELLRSNQCLNMLTTLINVKAFIPTNRNCDTKVLTDALTNISLLISNDKRNSATKSISQTLGSWLELLNSHSKRNNKLTRPKFTIDAEYQKDIKFKQFKEKTIGLGLGGDDTEHNYPLIVNNKTPEWYDYIKDPFNRDIRQKWINKVSPARNTKKQKLHTPPYGLQYESFTADIEYTDKKHTTRTIGADHINAYLIIPGLVYHLIQQVSPNVNDDDSQLELNIINFISRYCYATRKVQSVQLHAAYTSYCMGVSTELVYIQDFHNDGTYCVIPAIVFLTSLYNAAFLFQKNKQDNSLVTALKRFDIKSTVSCNTFLIVMSKS